MIIHSKLKLAQNLGSCIKNIFSQDRPENKIKLYLLSEKWDFNANYLLDLQAPPPSLVLKDEFGPGFGQICFTLSTLLAVERNLSVLNWTDLITSRPGL